MTLAMCEFAWCSIQRPAKIFRYSVLKEKNKIHTTQKPVALYAWLLAKYGKRGDKILDTHVGSASSLIACHNAGFQFWGFEIDADYYAAASRRLEMETAQLSFMDYAAAGSGDGAVVQLDIFGMLTAAEQGAGN